MLAAKSRIGWLDVAKGITIIFVVVGHLMQSYNPQMQIPFKIIYSFHMPAFFVFSGYLFNEKQCFSLFVKKKAKSLLLPYISFILLTFLYNIANSILKGNIKETLSTLGNSLVPTLLAESNSYFINLWFLPCLFSAMIILYTIFKITNKELFRGAICVILAFIILFLKSLYSFTLPLCIDNAMLAVFWLYIGHTIHTTDFIKYIRKQKILFSISALILFSLFNYIGLCIGGHTADSFRAMTFANYGISLLTGITGSLCVLSVSNILENNKPLITIGKRSNMIYGLHFLFIGIVVKIMSILPDSHSHIYISIQIILETLIIIFCVLIISHLYDKIKTNIKLNT